jgi:hypothetical protein
MSEALVKFDPDFVPVPQHNGVVRTEPVYLPPLAVAGSGTVYYFSSENIRRVRNITPSS